MDVISTIKHRHCCRAFLDKPIDKKLIYTLLEAARFAPSGGNMQPWQMVVLGKKTIQIMGDAILELRKRDIPPDPDYPYYPTEWFEPYQTRRRHCGMALYSALNISKEDNDKRQKQWNQNYHFFGAPIGLLCFINRKLATGSWLDMGLFIQNILLAAEDMGLATCPQASLAEYPNLIREKLKISDDSLLLCGIALGYPNLEDPVNAYRNERAPVEEFTEWFD